MTASTTTTIAGVSIFSRQRKRKADVFDIALSPEGIVIRRPGRAEQRMTWERISQWEIEERPGCVVLTLRGAGAVTPLMVKGWTLEDLETVMREVTQDTTGPVPDQVPRAAIAATAATATAALAVEPRVGPTQSRAARRQAAKPPRPSAWKPLVTIVLLGVLAAAVTVVLLQSAGVISWSFLGPVA
jgi:hypothetical protein